MFTYKISDGVLFRSDGSPIGTGYSGHGPGVNNIAFEQVHDVGPIPRGLYTIGEPISPPDHLGPVAMPLTPDSDTDTFGRSAFFIHGDNQAGDRSASHGCIIIGPLSRAIVNAASDRRLTVIA